MNEMEQYKKDILGNIKTQESQLLAKAQDILSSNTKKSEELLASAQIAYDKKVSEAEARSRQLLFDGRAGAQ